MRIHLINPRFPPSLWDFAACADLTGRQYAHPPLALPTLAALTPAPHTVFLTDENVEPVELDVPCDVVGITGYWIQRQRVFALADALRARGRRVALGGPIVEAGTLELCLEHADHVFVGEAEYTWPRFLSDLHASQAERVYWQRELVDMADSPCPRFELLKLDRYTTTTIETSRGCPQSCEFCEIPTRLGKRSRTKSAAQVLREVEALSRLGADSIFIVDDHFIGNRSHARRVLESLVDFVERVDRRVYFTCQFTINYARDAVMLDLLERANFRRVFVGVETPRRESLLSVGKKQNTVGDLIESVHALEARGLVVWAGMILGFDTDDADSFEEMARFLEAASIPVAMIGLLQAIPGTPLHARMEQQGRLRDLPFQGVRGTMDVLIASNIIPMCMSDRELAAGYQRLIAELYAPEAYGRRLLGALRRRTRRVPEGSRRPRLDDWKVVGRTLRHYLLRAAPEERRLFLHVLSRVLLECPDQLEAAMMHLVVYKHLRAFYGRVAAQPLGALDELVTQTGRGEVRLPVATAFD